MIWQIAKKDLYFNFQNSKIQILIIVIISLTFLVSILGVFEYKVNNEKYNHEVASNVSLINKQKVYATLYPKAIRPPQALSVLSKGDESDFGNSLTFNIEDIPYQSDRAYEANPYVSDFVNLDLTTIFIWLFSLISILISYDAIAKEKESGTMKLIFVSDLSRMKFLIAKMISSFLSVSFISLCAVIIVLLVFISTPWVSSKWNIIENFFLFFLISLFYILFWIFVGITSSIMSANSSNSLVRCLVVWICFLIVLPSLGKTVIGDTDFIKEKREVSQLTDNIILEYKETENEIWKRNFQPLIDKLQFSAFEGGPNNEPIWVANPMTMNAMIRYYLDTNSLKILMASQKQIVANEKYIMPLKKKIKQSYFLSFLSPITLYQQASMKIAGTSYENYFDYYDSFLIYRDMIIDYLSKRKALESRLWFMPEVPDPYAHGHPLCPKDIYNPTDEELEKIGEFYYEYYVKDDFINLNDFPMYEYKKKI